MKKFCRPQVERLEDILAPATFFYREAQGWTVNSLRVNGQVPQAMPSYGDTLVLDNNSPDVVLEVNQNHAVGRLCISGERTLKVNTGIAGGGFTFTVWPDTNATFDANYPNQMTGGGQIWLDSGSVLQFSGSTTTFTSYGSNFGVQVGANRGTIKVNSGATLKLANNLPAVTANWEVGYTDHAQPQASAGTVYVGCAAGGTTPQTNWILQNGANVKVSSLGELRFVTDGPGVGVRGGVSHTVTRGKIENYGLMHFSHTQTAEAHFLVCSVNIENSGDLTFDSTTAATLQISYTGNDPSLRTKSGGVTSLWDDVTIDVLKTVVVDAGGTLYVDNQWSNPSRIRCWTANEGTLGVWGHLHIAAGRLRVSGASAGNGSVYFGNGSTYTVTLHLNPTAGYGGGMACSGNIAIDSGATITVVDDYQQGWAAPGDFALLACYDGGTLSGDFEMVTFNGGWNWYSWGASNPWWMLYAAAP